MRQLIQKLRSQSGASILLALLFLLVCMLAAATVLMAAVSNAGKIRSNYDEQQRYLALSSALRLAAGELAKAEYTGKYTVTTWEEPAEWDEDGVVIGWTRYYRLDQAEGAFACGNLGQQPDNSAGCMVPLLEELDGLFGKKEAKGELETVKDYPGSKIHALRLRIDGTTSLLLSAFSDELNKIQLTVRMDESRRIRLIGTLTEGSQIYRMEAELIPTGAPVVSYAPPADHFPGIQPSAGAQNEIVKGPFNAVKAGEISSVKWELAWVVKEAEEG